MKHHAIIMGMPVIIQLVDSRPAAEQNQDTETIFNYFRQIDELFSTYKPNSEISRLNRGELDLKQTNSEVQKVLQLCEETKQQTNGYFDVTQLSFPRKRESRELMHPATQINPTGLVKGYAIWQAAQQLQQKKYRNFCLEIAGDMQAQGHNESGQYWQIGIENPFNRQEIIKVVQLNKQGIATSSTSIRGLHIYDPIHHQLADKIASISVIAPNVYEADRFATAAFAMGEEGIRFIESQPNLEGYMITKDQRAVFSSGFAKYTTSS